MNTATLIDSKFMYDVLEEVGFLIKGFSVVETEDHALMLMVREKSIFALYSADFIDTHELDGAGVAKHFMDWYESVYGDNDVICLFR